MAECSFLLLPILCSLLSAAGFIPPIRPPYAVDQTTLITFAGSTATSLAVGVVLWRRKIVHPEAFGASEAKQRDVWNVPAPIWFVCGAMVFLAIPFVVGLANKLPPDALGAAGSVQNRVVPEVAGYLGAIAIGAMLIYLIWPRTSEKSGLRPRWSDISWGVVCIALAAPFYIVTSQISQAISTQVFKSPPPPVAHDTLEFIVKARESVWGWVRVGTVVLLVPVVEELIYRVFLASCLLNLLHRTWPAVLVTSGLFAGVHFSVVPPAALPGLFVLGAAMGVAYERTRRLGVPIVMHALFNAANVAFAVWFGR